MMSALKSLVREPAVVPFSEVRGRPPAACPRWSALRACIAAPSGGKSAKAVNDSGKPVANAQAPRSASRRAVYASAMRRIAIVEDEPAIRANYADALRRHGYEVAAYASRPEAMAAFRTRLPDLALVDIGLGDEVDGGFTLTRELRAMSPTLPIIF